ncbi:MAG TPA: hypothetical protein VEU08_05390 [Vicinamibacterales bacterium]|nr:hypothetical protein [Vicinamibacterales bacterium]
MATTLAAAVPTMARAQLTDGDKLPTPGARASAMGGTFVGVDDDATAAVSNPAGVQLLVKPQAYFEFTRTAGEPVQAFTMLTTNRPSFVSFAAPLGDRVSIAITHNEQYFVSSDGVKPCPGCAAPHLELSSESYSSSLAVYAGAGWRVGATISHDDVECDGVSPVCAGGSPHGASLTTGVLWQGSAVSIGASGVVASEQSPVWNRFSIGGSVRTSPHFLVAADLDTIQIGHQSGVYVTEPHVGAELEIPAGGVSWYLRGGAFKGFGADSITDRAATVGAGFAGGHLQADIAYVSQRHRVVVSTAVRF